MNRSTKSIITAILKAFRANSTFFIAGHVRPDGDSIGSALALQSLLRRMGKKAEVYTRDPLPPFLCGLPHACGIRQTDRVKRKFDCAIILECSDLSRMGNLIELDQADTVINIDHHAVSGDYGHINYVDSEASSTAEMVYGLFRVMSKKPTAAEAAGLYAGLVTDTGRFQQSNTTASSLRMAADLVEAGVVPVKMYESIYASNSMGSLHLLGMTLSTLQCSDSGKVAWMCLTNKMLSTARVDASETEGIVNYALTIPGVVASILFRETEKRGKIKASMRSRRIFDVNAVARHFGGGGHRNASGCTLSGSLPAASGRLLRYLNKVLEQQPVR